MRIPPRREPPRAEAELHPRALQRDPMILADLYELLAEKIIRFVMTDLKCSEEIADNAVFDALTAYVQQPDRYNPQQVRLITYLTQVAKSRARDRLRSELASTRREKEFGQVVELWQRPPKEQMENAVEAARAMERLKERGLLKDKKDTEALGLLLSGERSTEEWARVLGLTSLPVEERRREVKRFRDRLVKMLERSGKEDSDE